MLEMQNADVLKEETYSSCQWFEGFMITHVVCSLVDARIRCVLLSSRVG